MGEKVPLPETHRESGVRERRTETETKLETERTSMSEPGVSIDRSPYH